MLRGRLSQSSSTTSTGNISLFGMPPANDIIDGSTANFMSLRISEERRFLILEENSIIVETLFRKKKG
jgi:hypothetical protein